MPGIVADAQAASEQQQKARKPTKNELRRAKKKAQKRDAQDIDGKSPVALEPNANRPVQPIEPQPDDPIQDVPDVAPPMLSEDDPLYSQFAGVFAKFQDSVDEVAVAKPEAKQAVFFDDDDNVQGEEEEEALKHKLSKKQRKKACKLSIAELKAMVRKPEIVEWTDVDSHDPKLLVNIKSTRNMVPVPTHWSLKREYLSSKRGIEKQNFRLPKFIAETGIAEMRQNALDASAEQSLKQKARERVNPAMNRLDIDYQKLFEAFFRRQTKPHLTRYGEVYYEGKEYETNLRHLRPGDISDGLREALNMPAGAPRPWLINMQRTGPPPSYPAMKVPGVNAPLPPGASWGFEPGQFGKAPINANGQPMWGGDLYGFEDKARHDARKTRRHEPPVSRAYWGEINTEEEAEAPVEEEEEEEEEEQQTVEPAKEEDTTGTMTGAQTPFGGAATPSGFHTSGTKSIAAEFDLRKKRSDVDAGQAPRAAGQVLRERAVRSEGFFGGERAYDLDRPETRVLGSESDDRGRKRKAGAMDVSMDMDAMGDEGLSKAQLQQRYDEARGAQGGGGFKVDQDDLSNMIAEENAKRLKREQGRQR